MFFYPDPEPIGHRITDVSPSYLSDGVFFNANNIGPTHKCVGKQLSAIRRGPNDPVQPFRTEVNPRTLENWTIDSKAWYVDNCGRNAKALYGMMKLLPKEKVDPYAGWKSKVSPFPRSEQYEYSYTRKNATNNDMRCVKEAEREEKGREAFGRCAEIEEGNESLVPTTAFRYTATPIWWKDDIPKRDIHSEHAAAVGIPDDYGFQIFDDDYLARNNRTDKSKTTCETKRNEAKNEMLVSLVRAVDPVKAKIIDGEGEHPKDVENCDYSRSHTPAPPKNVDEDKLLKYKTAAAAAAAEEEEEEDLKRAELKDDPRWNSSSYDDVSNVKPRTDLDRKNAMLNLHKPYYHEINTWYSRNKPTKLLPTLISEGKRAIVSSHFSNL